ncbi:LysR family transcriptional regulator [Castellaniella sp.]|uniref:LysR family transcriptional regulator n=1 Tax=Castellaniella sp. TaxID=1955812 RepID=UPI00356258E6
MSWYISLRELEVFLGIVDEGTVTAAADRAGMTQSAASQALLSLEKGLSTPLFDRIGRKLLLNAQGHVFLPRARTLVDQAQELQRLFTDDAGIFLRLGASTTIGNHLLPALLARFRQAHPRASIQLMVGNTADVVEAVTQLRIDAGFVEGPSHHPELLMTPWQADRMCVFAAADHALARGPVSLPELARAPWVLREPGSGTREEVERLLLPHLGRLEAVMELGQSEAIKQLVAAGMGISCLSRHVIAEWLEQGRLVELRSPLPQLERSLYRIQHKDKPGSRAMMLFDALLRAHFVSGA